MIYRALTKDGDYSFGAGRQNLLQGAAAVAQAILTRLKLLRGEWWEDLSDGLPLWQEILGKRQPKEFVDSLILERITGTPNVREVIEYESAWDNETRRYTFTARVNTAFGDITLPEVTF
jgi:hypothetical protein